MSFRDYRREPPPRRGFVCHFAYVAGHRHRLIGRGYPLLAPRSTSRFATLTFKGSITLTLPVTPVILSLGWPVHLRAQSRAALLKVDPLRVSATRIQRPAPAPHFQGRLEV